MTTITVEIPDDLAAKINLVTLPILLRELVGHKAVQLQAIEESDALVGSSRVDLQACKLEYSIVSPK